MSKKNKIICICISLAIVLAVILGSISPIFKVKATTATFNDTEEVLLNPGKGFVHYGADYNTQTKFQRPYFTAGYHRFRWNDLEPEEGVYDFSKIDSWLNDYVHWGKKFAFGVMCVDASYSGQYVTPKYIFQKTDNYLITTNSKKQYIPDWQDEVFLSALDNFVAALGERYNGNENIAFIDILSYGNYGEQHLFGIDVDVPNYSSKNLISPEFLKERYIQPYIDAFPDTMLVNPWGTEKYDEMYFDLFESGVTVRRDGICKYTNGLDVLASAFGKLPVIFEYAGNYKDNIKDGTEEEFNRMLEEAIQIAKPSYIELDNDWYEKNPEYLKDLANRMGYYFRLKEAKYYKNVKKNKKTNISFVFKNDGVAPIYVNSEVYIGLLNSNGEVVKQYLTDINPKNIMPGEPHNESINIKFDGESGTYTLAIGFTLKGQKNPSIKLGSEGNVGNDWYAIGEINLK